VGALHIPEMGMFVEIFAELCCEPPIQRTYSIHFSYPNEDAGLGWRAAFLLATLESAEFP
jgi:hypothetical protein